MQQQRLILNGEKSITTQLIEMGFKCKPTQDSREKKNISNITTATKAIIKEFLKDKKASNRSQSTINLYNWVLEDFFSRTCKNVDNVSYDDVSLWLDHYRNGKKPKTIKIVLGVLRVFYTYCVSEGYSHIVPIKKRWKPKLKKSAPKYIGKYDLARIRIMAEDLPIRDRAIIAFLESTGVRRSELVSLNISDLNFRDCTAHVLGKGKKHRYVSFSESCSFLLQEMLKDRQEQDGPLFLNRAGQRLSDKHIYRLTKSLGEKLGMNSSLHPHRFRHTKATGMVEKGIPIEQVQLELGHSEPSTTQIYAFVMPAALRSAYDKAMG